MSPTARSVWAVVPMKGLARGKSRLRASLSDDRREQLARDMFEHVLQSNMVNFYEYAMAQELVAQAQPQAPSSRAQPPTAAQH